MPVFFQHQINATTRLGIWKIEETEAFFKGNVPVHREVTHPHKRLQHLAGRFLLQYLYPAFPYELIRIAETRKPFVENEAVHFSISHCGDFAAAIISTTHRVGIDIEIPVPQILRIKEKFLNKEEMLLLQESGLKTIDYSLPTADYRLPTLLWSAKEAVYKWYGEGRVDFKQDIQLTEIHRGLQRIDCWFNKSASALFIRYSDFNGLVLAWVVG